LSCWPALAAPFLGLYPVFVMKLLCFALFACAFNLLLGFTGLLSFGHAAFFGSAAYVTGWFIKSQAGRPSSACWPARWRPGLGLLVGLVAIRRQGIYFAMITLAIAQMVYFVCLQASFTGGEDGLQGVPRGKLFGLLPLGIRHLAVLRGAGDVCGLLPVHLAHRALALRPGAQDDPRERTARHLAGLQRRPLQAAGLCAVGRAGRPGRLAEDAGHGFCHAVRRALVHVRRGHPDDLLGGVGTFFGPVMGLRAS
jgi:branched-chain amino acid transport system permease protein